MNGLKKWAKIPKIPDPQFILRILRYISRTKTVKTNQVKKHFLKEMGWLNTIMGSQ